jgi:hypothetical protein
MLVSYQLPVGHSAVHLFDEAARNAPLLDLIRADESVILTYVYSRALY